MNPQPNSPNNGQAQNVQSGGDDRNHPDSEKVRRFVQEKIYEYLILRRQQSSSNFSTRRMIDLTRLFDKALFNAASTLDEYMNVDTLEVRLISYLKQLRNRYNQRLLQQQQMNQRLLQQQQQMNQRLLQQQQQMNQRLLQQQQQMNRVSGI